MDSAMKRRRMQNMIATIIIAALSGINYVWSLTSAALVSDHGWTNSQASLPYSLFTVMASLMVLFGGRFIDKRPTRQLVLFAGICYAVGLIGAANLMNQPTLFAICYGMILACGTGCITASQVGPVVKWFPYRQRGLVSGIMYTASGLTGIYMSPICNHIVGTYGVKASLIGLGVTFSLIIIIAHFFIHTADLELVRQAEIEEAAAYKDAVPFEVKEYSWGEMLKTSNFWKIFITFTALCLCGLMIIGKVTAIAVLQAGWQGGFLLLVLNSLFSIAGRLSCGAIGVKIGFKKVWIAMSVLQLVNMLCFRFYTTIPTLLIGAVIGGICFGGIWSISPSVISGEFGKKNCGVNFGILHLGYAVGGFIGPMLAGHFMDTYGNYNKAYIMAAAILAVGLISALTMPKDCGVPKPAEN